MARLDTVRGDYVLYVYCTYRLKWKPIFDGLVLGVLDIKGHEKLACQTQL